MKFTIKGLLTLALCAAMAAGCSAAPNALPNDSSAIPAQPDKPVLLAVSFGSSYNETREATIGAIEKALQSAYPDHELRRAFTSQTVIDILKEREGLEIDNVAEAMERLAADGIKQVVVQPTHVMTGQEYDDLTAELEKYAGSFESVKTGAPLLGGDADYDALVKALIDETKQQEQEGTAIVFMGHGTHHAANASYEKLQQSFIQAGYDNCFVGTVEAEPSLEDVMALLKESGAEKVVLLPLMVVAGDHASNDMAGDEEGSWKTELQKAGYEVQAVLKGLGEYEGVQRMFVEHAAAAM